MVLSIYFHFFFFFFFFGGGGGAWGGGGEKKNNKGFTLGGEKKNNKGFTLKTSSRGMIFTFSLSFPFEAISVLVMFKLSSKYSVSFCIFKAPTPFAASNIISWL